MDRRPLEALAQSANAFRALEEVMSHQARACRNQGFSWSDIANAAGVSKVTAMNKWKEIDMTALPDRDYLGDGEWNIGEGESLPRRQLHARYGGNVQSGISSSTVSDNVFLFSSPNGKQFGYAVDGWQRDGSYEYTGEGQRGDQTMTRGNKAIVEHQRNGKRLRLFESDGMGLVTYVCELQYVTHRTERISQADSQQLRDGFIFSLRRARPRENGRGGGETPYESNQ